ncbi:MAG: protein kinase domain-containing protein [Planctomycetota bacterium]
MSKTEEQNDKRPNGEGAGPPRSFGGSAVGPGSQIGPFRIERELGRGAVGVVYLAHDTKLDRSVAIKGLPAEVLEKPEARSRFSREARLLASLNHPNIATIYDEFEEVEGVCYLILEYVPGQTLAERIAGTRLKLDEALSIALQITEAVAAAHERGVIHRDLKPSNIKITPEGKVMVLDFGLAKAAGGEAADQQSTATEPGRVIGTAAYMSPEQARGKPTDKRSDIWAFGCILYEMLTATIPFKGETFSDTLANVLQTAPNWEALPERTPTNIQILLLRCLAKDPRRRLRDIGDAGIEISETLADVESGGVVTAPLPGVSRTSRLRWLIAAIAGVVFVAAAASLVTWSLKLPTPMPPSRFPISPPQSQMLNEDRSQIAVSPDGKRLIYVGGIGRNSQLILREVDQVEGQELSETTGALQPFFSPDGQSIGFSSGGKLKTLFLDGGRPKTLCDASALMGASWGQDGVIYFSPATTTGLWRISADGGDPESVTTPHQEKDEFGHWWPEVLPGGEAVLFTIWKTNLNDVQVVALLRETGELRTLLIGGSHARYAPTGHLLYAESGTLMAAPFDLKQLKVGEPRRPVVEGLRQSPTAGDAPFCFSQDGLLYYVRGGEWLARRQLVWVNRQGEEVEQLSLPPQAYADLRLSPDGRRLALAKFERGAFNVWVYDLPSGPATQLTFESNNSSPLWIPDGNWLTFTSWRAGPFDIYRVPVDRSGNDEPLVTGPYDQVATSWSPDSKILLFTETSPVTGEDIWFLSVEDSNTPRPLLCESWNERSGVFSPDGNWIAYQSDREGSDEVYVTPFPGPVAKKISTGGGHQPMWSRDGKELFYRAGDKMKAAIIETEPEFTVTDSEELFAGKHLAGWGRSYDVSGDGQRFLMVKEGEEKRAATQLIVVLNWFEELKRLVPTGKSQ